MTQLFINATSGAGGDSANNGLAPTLIDTDGPVDKWADMFVNASTARGNLVTALGGADPTVIVIGQLDQSNQGTAANPLLAWAAAVSPNIARPLRVLGTSDAQGTFLGHSDRRWVSYDETIALHGASTDAPTEVASRATLDGKDASASIFNDGAVLTSNIVFANLIFRKSAGRGAQITSSGQAVTFVNCVFEEFPGWGVVATMGGLIRFQRCIFYRCNLNNIDASPYGGGAYGNVFSDCDFVDCGGRMAQCRANFLPVICDGCRFWLTGNFESTEGIGVLAEASGSVYYAAQYTRCTFHNLTAGIAIGNLDLSSAHVGSANVVIRECVFSNCLDAVVAFATNTRIAELSGCHFYNPTGNDVTNVTAIIDDGNTTGDPQFVDPLNGDFRLKPGSPAIRADGSAPGGAAAMQRRRRVFSLGA